MYYVVKLVSNMGDKEEVLCIKFIWQMLLFGCLSLPGHFQGHADISLHSVPINKTPNYLDFVSLIVSLSHANSLVRICMFFASLFQHK